MFYQRVSIFFFSLFILPLHAAVAVVADETRLAVWANEAIVATYSYNYQNFLTRQKEIARYFTSTGWINYSTALQNSKLPESVQKNAYFVSAVATLPPVIKTINAKRWQAIMPVLVLYKNPQYQQKQTLNITLDFQRSPKGEGVRGLEILSLDAKVASPACECAEKKSPSVTIT